jgi:hypothetical protein
MSKRVWGAMTLAAMFSLVSCTSPRPRASSERAGIGIGPARSPSGYLWDDDFHSKDPNHLTVALKFVSYTETGQKPVLAPDQVKSVVHTVNQIYSQCNLHFRVEAYDEVQPETDGLSYNPSTMKELGPIRQKFDDPRRLVVITTGAWNHKGGLGADGANAWTAMPGSTPSGAVIEQGVASTANLVAHELGHYLNLDHTHDTTNLMNPVIYSGSNELSHEQCEDIRKTALDMRSEALRHS